MKIEFKDLLFSTDADGRVLLDKCFFVDNGKKSTNFKMTPVFDVAGGSNSGEVNQKSCDALSRLRYKSHTLTENRLTIVQACENVEVTSHYESFTDTNAIRVTQSVKNMGDAPLTLEVLHSFNFTFGTGILEHRDWLLHRFTNYRYTESMPDVRSLYDLGLYWKNGAYRFLNIGPASSVEYVPQGILENRLSGDYLMFAIESYTDWYAEIACTYADAFTFVVGGPNARYHQWCRTLVSGESYTSVPVTLCSGKSVNDVLAQMTRYRRHIKPICNADASLPVIYNEYMHYSWDDPFAVRALETAPSVAEVGSNYYIIDCGWHNSKSADNTTSMYKLFGTWYEDKSRFPDGIKAVAEAMHAQGMKFGLWLAPEVVGCENREMLEYYGDECFLQRNGKKIFNGTGHTLDFRHPKVIDYMTKTIDRMVNDYGCDYIKFDACPNPGVGSDYHTEMPGTALEDAYAAFTAWSTEMIKKYPDVIFEDCFGGGERMDYKALSMFHLISTSDQTDYLHYPYITANIFASVLPEQAGVWSYPVDFELFDPDAPEKTNERVSKERVVLNMVNAVLGRIHLASRIHLLDAEKKALIREGIDFYNAITEEKLRAVPYLPLGYAKFGDTTVSVGLKTEDKLYLAVWNLRGERSVTIPFHEFSVKNASVAYPKTLATDFTFTEGSLTVNFTEDEQARIFEISL